ncbi:hypothetical protein G4926_12035 [Anaerostipes hadrus]|jgi:DnaJ-domain-containing protein 1|uniref:hypothetical protein n=1 Tax=Anaerostipes hadrus TaxID=649756 RepID=UPI0002A38BC8|nr:hypothetical protein [Anaerostipes hadrus]EKY24917.1 hypothetical protein HMPREF0369_00324 [Anaerostipes hadrus ATCC 29173 = JCM 17467]NSG77217.1 hypothetical protein [Anaerostipes hadrus]BEG59058.1 hypothetical protein Ahadr17467_06880 [Anaerostipes hadrus ATCC 29173 = JCM 17467]
MTRIIPDIKREYEEQIIIIQSPNNVEYKNNIKRVGKKILEIKASYMEAYKEAEAMVIY